MNTWRLPPWAALVVVCLLALSDWAAADPKTLPPPDLFVFDDGSQSIIRITAEGEMTVWKTKAKIRSITGHKRVNFRDVGAASDGLGNLYFTDAKSDTVLKYDYVTGLDTLATRRDIKDAGGGSPAPKKMAFLDGFLYVQDPGSDSILRVDPITGEVTLLVDDDTIEALPGIGYVDPDGGIAASGGLLYFASDGAPDALFSVDAAGTPATVSTDGRFSDLDSYTTVAPNGDLIVINDDDFDDEFTIFRVTAGGDVSVFLSEGDIEAITGEGIDLEAGIAFDPAGNFYVAERASGNILRFDTDGNGSIFVSAADFENLTGSMPRLRGAIIWASVPNPEPGTIALVGLGAAALVWHRRRKRRLAECSAG